MALEGGEGSASRPGRSLPPGKTRYPLYRRQGGPQGRSGQVRKISLPPGFDLRNVQPVASRYTDYATRPTSYYVHVINLNRLSLSLCMTNMAPQFRSVGIFLRAHCSLLIQSVVIFCLDAACSYGTSRLTLLHLMAS